MRFSLALTDHLRPAVAEWLTAMTPTGVAALRSATTLIRRRTVGHMRAQLRRRTGKRAPLRASSVGTKVDRMTGGHPYALLWFKRGILAAHELGSTIPGGVERPRQKKILAWGGPPGGPHTHFARAVSRPTRTLRRRPMLVPAYQQSEAEVLALLDAAYQQAFAEGSTARAIRERIGA